ncbi:DNA/RNA non-specific endonuclease [Chitinophaga agrisoli]|nr:DNA/RNA non-specific endonuclease [Chitinophaga agrisoli]
MPNEYQPPMPGHITNTATASPTRPGGAAFPAVDPLQQKKEPQALMPAQLSAQQKQVSGAPPVTPPRFVLPAASATIAQPVDHGRFTLGSGPAGRPPLQAKAPAVTGTPVVQRALHTKESVFIDQLKHQLVAGIYNFNGPKYDDHTEFLNALKTAGLIDIGNLLNETYKDLKYGGKAQTQKTQAQFYSDEKDKGFKLVTMDAVRKHGLLIDGLSLAESSATWDDYRPRLDNTKKKNESQASLTVEGVGGGPGAGASTKIKWDEIDTTAKEGKKMTALVLGPDHPLGSPPGDDGKIQSSNLTKKTGKAYIGGHLLNDHLGGPGTDRRNITALPKDVNTEQSDKIEEEVKKRVNGNGEVVFYQVQVTYGNDVPLNVPYAKNLYSAFGTYRQGTDFSDPKFTNFGSIPKADLEDFYEHHLPIESPSDYAKQTGTGYKLTDDKTYTSGKKRAPAFNNTNLTAATGKKAVFSINKENDLLLKDAKQVKLEFISFAIYSLPIAAMREKIQTLEVDVKDKEEQRLKDEEALKEMEEQAQEHEGLVKEQSAEIGRLQKDAEWRDRLLNEGATEIGRLEKEAEQRNEFMQQLRDSLSEIFEKVLEEKEQQPDINTAGNKELLDKVKELRSALTSQKEELLASREELKRVKVELQQVKEKLERTKEKLRIARAERDKYHQQSSHRAKGQGALYSLLRDDPEYRDYAPPSPSSKNPWEEGSQIGNIIYDEISTLKSENAFLLGKTAALDQQQMAGKLGQAHGYGGFIPPENVELLLLKQLFSQYDWKTYSDDFVNGFKQGMVKLIESYISGFQQGRRNKSLEMQFEQQQQQWPPQDNRFEREDRNRIERRRSPSPRRRSNQDTGFRPFRNESSSNRDKFYHPRDRYTDERRRPRERSPQRDRSRSPERNRRRSRSRDRIFRNDRRERSRERDNQSSSKKRQRSPSTERRRY